ncbi:MAG: hypothetical protein Q8K78_06345, partial [Planctomycetaceae bacterium]|nr:hypothetical protein [Planctomycetaceae bacterium]
MLLVGGFVAREQLSPYLGLLSDQFASLIPGLAAAEDRFDHLSLERVKRGPLQITVLEKGQLDSARNAVLTSKVEGTTTIISIVPEGTMVKKDQLVVELDSSLLIDKERQQDIAVTQAVSAKQSAEKDVEIQRTQNDSDKAAAELKLTLAQIDLKKFKLGDSK